MLEDGVAFVVVIVTGVTVAGHKGKIVKDHNPYRVTLVVAVLGLVDSNLDGPLSA